MDIDQVQKIQKPKRETIANMNLILNKYLANYLLHE